MKLKTVFPTRVGVNRTRPMMPKKRQVFPTRVGVNRVPARHRVAVLRFPHTRGGEPLIRPCSSRQYSFSPHAWG